MTTISPPAGRKVISPIGLFVSEQHRFLLVPGSRNRICEPDTIPGPRDEQKPKVVKPIVCLAQPNSDDRVEWFPENARVGPILPQLGILYISGC